MKNERFQCVKKNKSIGRAWRLGDRERAQNGAMRLLGYDEKRRLVWLVSLSLFTAPGTVSTGSLSEISKALVYTGRQLRFGQHLRRNEQRVLNGTKKKEEEAPNKHEKLLSESRELTKR